MITITRNVHGKHILSTIAVNLSYILQPSAATPALHLAKSCLSSSSSLSHSFLSGKRIYIPGLCLKGTGHKSGLWMFAE